MTRKTSKMAQKALAEEGVSPFELTNMRINMVAGH